MGKLKKILDKIENTQKRGRGLFLVSIKISNNKILTHRWSSEKILRKQDIKKLFAKSINSSDEDIYDIVTILYEKNLTLQCKLGKKKATLFIS